MVVIRMLRTDFNYLTQPDDAGQNIFTLLASAPGGGKSETIIEEMATVPSVYLFVVPRIELIREQVARLETKAAAAGHSPTIVPVHSRVPGVKRGVVRTLRDAIDAVVDQHTVIVTTHAAAMGLYSTDFEGLHVRWDENPEAATPSGSIGLATSWPAMRERYTLTPSHKVGWYRVNLRPGLNPISLGQIRGDVGAEKLAEFHRLAGSGGRVVEVNIGAWEDASVPGAPPVRWRSIWSLAALCAAASVTVAAAGYPGSLADHALRCAGGVRIETVRVGGPRTGQPRVRIHYYTLHPASTLWWKTKEGRACLVAISRHLEADRFSGFWAANADIVPFFTGRVGGEECSPKLAGTNGLRHHRSAAVIYSAKATPDDEAIIEALGLDRDGIRDAREGEDLYQFICRGALRDPGYAGGYDAFVYDIGQAERLRARLIADGFEDVTLVPVIETEIMDIVRPKTSHSGKHEAPAIGATIETAAERTARLKVQEAQRGRNRRAKERADKEAAGIRIRPRGRPPGPRRSS
jgi:hypothetical protein